MRQAFTDLDVPTKGRGFTDVTARLQHFVTHEQAVNGVLTVLIKHTSASLLIQENADPSVRADLETFFSSLVPDSRTAYEHDAEGPDDMPSHIRAALTQPSVSIPVRDGALALGTWQAIYLFEHRHHGQRRTLAMHFIGD